MASRTGLFFVHRVLIGMAIALGGIVLWHGVTMYRARGDVASLATGIGAAVVSVGLGFYLRWFLRKK
jgi:hypothetical protein